MGSDRWPGCVEVFQVLSVGFVDGFPVLRPSATLSVLTLFRNAIMQLLALCQEFR